MTAAACPVPRADGGLMPCANPGRPTVTLVTGTTCCSWCEAWRAETAARETEARRIIKLPDKPSRHAALADHESSHGTESRARLQAVILSIWERRRAAANQGAA